MAQVPTAVATLTQYLNERQANGEEYIWLTPQARKTLWRLSQEGFGSGAGSVLAETAGHATGATNDYQPARPEGPVCFGDTG